MMMINHKKGIYSIMEMYSDIYIFIYVYTYITILFFELNIKNWGSMIDEVIFC